MKANYCINNAFKGITGPFVSLGLLWDPVVNAHMVRCMIVLKKVMLRQVLFQGCDNAKLNCP